MLKKDDFFKNYFTNSRRYYENLPVPDETATISEEISIFENTLETSAEDNSSTSNSIESSILKKIQSK